MNSRPVHLIIGTVAIVAGLVVTFVQSHSAAFGHIVFGAWAVATVAAVALIRFRQRDLRFEVLDVVNGTVTLAAGVAALVIPATPSSFAWLTGLWAVVFGALALRGAISESSGRVRWSEAMFVPVASLAFGVLQLLMPINAVVNVGVLGAYWVVVGSWLVIGALSPRPAQPQGSSE